MPSKWKFPRYGESWSECQWCGQLYPSSQVWLNPRYGWQCYKCWDGLIQRDQILQPIFPFEGTRRTPSPVTNTLTEGVGGPLDPTYDYFLRDRITGTVYEVHFPPFGIVDGLIIYFTTTLPTLTVSTETNNVWDGLRGITSGWDVYVRNGALATELNFDLNLEIVDGICDFGAIPSNCIIYLRDINDGTVYLVDLGARPPTATIADNQSVTPVFDAAQLPNGFFAIVSGTLVATATVNPEWVIYTNDCFNSLPLGGTGIPVTFTVDCPAMVVSFLSVSFTANPPIVGVTNYHWDFGDGSSVDTGTTLTTSHTYSSGGTYDVVLTVTAFGTSISSANCPVTVAPEVISVSCPSTSISGLTVDFAATPPGGIVTNYHWDFGDSSTTDTGTTSTVSHTYASGGTYDVILTVTTTTGVGSSGACPVTVAGAAFACPEVIITEIPVVACPSAVIGCLFVDFTATPPDIGIVTNYHWDFGDGNSTDSGTIVTTSHSYATPGTYNVVLTVTTNIGDAVSGNCPISPFTVACPSTVIAGLHVDFTATPITGATNYNWDFGDTTVINTGTTPTASHTYGAPGTYDVFVTVTTDTGDCTSDACPVTVS